MSGKLMFGNKNEKFPEKKQETEHNNYPLFKLLDLHSNEWTQLVIAEKYFWSKMEKFSQK